MTGFGKATLEYGNKKIVVEVKSLNSKPKRNRRPLASRLRLVLLKHRVKLMQILSLLRA